MTNEKKISELNYALSIINNLLVDSEDEWEVKVYSKLYKKVNAVYVALCEERLEEKKNA